LDSFVLLRPEQSGATILTFHPRPEPDRRASEGEAERRRAFPGAERSNRPSAVFREIIWAMAIPVGTVLLFRAAFGLVLAL